MVVKKKRRTAKQIAATKKRRTAKKKTVKRKTVKRSTAKKGKTVKRKTNPSPRFYVAFVRVGNSKYYYSGYDSSQKRATFDDDIKKALWYRDKKQAVEEVTFLGKTTGALNPRKHKVETELFSPGK